MKLALLIPALAISCCLASAAEVLYEKSAPGALDSSVLVAEREFSKEDLERMARQFLDAHETLHVKKLSVFVDKGAEVRLRFGKAMSHPSYYHAQQNRDVHDGLPVVAEVLGLRGSAVLRARMPDGSIWSNLLQGSDPLRIKQPGVDAEILFVHFHEWGFNGSDLAVQIFVKVIGGLSVEKAERVAETLWKEIPYSGVVVVVRNDEWFIESEGYPCVNPYLPLALLPPYERFAKTTLYYCSFGGSKGCMEFGLMYPVPAKEPDAPIRERRPK